MGDTGRKAALFEQFARVGKALGSGKRLEILDLLAQTERPVEALATAAALNVTTASAHLQTLKQAGLVATRRDGTKIFYRLAGPDVADLIIRAARGRHRAPARCRSRPRRLPRCRQGRVDRARRTTAPGRGRPGRRARRTPGPGVRGRPSTQRGQHPARQLADRIGELPADADVVAYCRGPYCVFAHDAVRLLSRHGRRAIRLTDGITEWRLAGLPVATA